jgi:hypothetical protein
MIRLSELILMVLSIGMAYWQSRLIKKNRPIYHGLWAAAVAILILAAGWWVRGSLVLTYKFILYGIAQASIRLAVFNVCLNRFRGLDWNYVSKSTTSIIDQIEYDLFGARVWFIETFLTVVFIVLQFFL